MAIIKPRLNDYHGIPFTQEEVSFAIPFLDEDIPLYLDPFLLYKSPSQQDFALHSNLISTFNKIGHLYAKDTESALEILISASECDEVGLGDSSTRKGIRIGRKTAISIFDLYSDIPQIKQTGIAHLEIIQLLVDGISKDRVSDLTCSFIKSFLVDYTIQECDKYSIPTEKVYVQVFDPRSLKFIAEETCLPVNPETRNPIILVPKRWLRFVPWINFDDYFSSALFKEKIKSHDRFNDRIEILKFNRENYGLIETFVSRKELDQKDCKNDPLFKQLPITSTNRKKNLIISLPTGKSDNADKKYEDGMVQLLSSMLYPHLDFAEAQSRIDSGSQIRDLIFYNNKSYNFLEDLYDSYDCKQIVVELKNVEKLEREHVNQLNRYMSDQFGRFGIIFTRKSVPRNIRQNIIDLWSGQRKCIIVMDDVDLRMMCDIYESRQRSPIDVIKKKNVEFIRTCPS